MKELSIEEKAKRYDKAIERAKNYYSTTDSASDIKLIGLIFPELKESEEEGIRKEILDYIIKGSESLYDVQQYGKERFEKWIAWIEKQCEQKLYVNDNAKEMFIKALERVEEQNNKGYKLTDCDKNSWWEDFKAYTYCTIEQKPAWSEEDERMFDVVRDLAWKGYKDNDDNNLPTFGTIVDWLKSIKNRVLQLKQTWSEEDDFHYTRLENFLEVKEHEANSSQYQSEVHKTLKWLKSLSPQPHWKPSDEQMDALHYVTNFDYGGHKATLVSLYEQLKKLKG